MIPGIKVAERGLLRGVHPLAKVACTSLLFIFCLIIPKVPEVLLYFVFVFGLLVLSRLGWLTLKLLILISPFALLVGMVNFIGWNSPSSGILSGMRIFFMGMSVVLFAFTTTPAELVRSLESVRFPRMLTLGTLVAMRFVPIFIEEWKRIIQSMRLRGGPFVRNPYFYYRALCVPLIYKIFTVSDTLALSLYTRGFTPDGRRTCYKEMPFRARDGLFLGAFTLISIALAVI